MESKVMKEFLMSLWEEEDGAETAEWIIIVDLLLVGAIAIYNGFLRNELNGVVSDIGTTLNGLPTT